MIRPWHSLRGRLLLLALLVEAVMLTLLVTNSLRLLTDNMTEQARENAEQIAPVLNAALVAPLAQRDHATLRAVVQESQTAQGFSYLAVTDRQGKVLALAGWPEGRPLPAADNQFSIFKLGGLPRYDVVTPINLSGQALGQLHFGLDLSRIVAAHGQLLNQGVAIALGELLLSAGLMLLLGYYLTRHLGALARASEAVAAGNLTPQPLVEGRDEVGRLAAAFNAMSRAVAERIGELTAAHADQARLTEEVEAERARLAALLESMAFGVLYADPAGKVVYANPAFCHLWALPEAPAAHTSELLQLLGERENELADYPALRAALQARQEDYEFSWRDGRIYTLHRRPVQDSHGQPLGAMWVFEDVTDARLTAQQLIAARDAAEQASRAKAAFLATMSHEVRTPMNGIIGMTDLALQTELSGEQREYLQWAKSSAESLLTILNDILDFSKIEAGRMELESVPLDIPALLNHIVGLFSADAQKKGLALSWRAEGALPGNLAGDPVRLRQILTNLVSNAIKFTASGSVTLAVWAQPLEGDGRERLHFTVADTGIGIPVDKREHIFSPFTQAERFITRKFGGTGLGLTIVARLVELMYGRIWLESEPGRGTTFHFTIGFGRINPVRPQAEAGEIHDLPGARILLVEDTPVNQRLGQVILQKHGYKVTLAEDGLVALNLLAAQEFDLILMDVQMPNMDGLEATRRLRQLEAAGRRRTPVVALTANALAGDRETCLAAGMDDFLAKPFHADEMYAVVGRHLG
ncbi:MAG: hypothetical protein RIR00_1225 [Pseudomonadota bacterium]|jgi:PAS domain S-box-containing protein